MIKRRAFRLVRSRSRIHGQGVFAEEDIPRGIPVLECGGIVLPRSRVARGSRVMQIGPDTYLAEDPENGGLDDFLNHSCQPNLGFVTGSLVLHSLGSIASGDELCFDYGSCMNEPGWALACNCGASACRGVVQSFCELPRPEQARLRRIALAYLREPRL